MTNNSENLSVNDFGKVCRTCLAFLADGEIKNLYENCTVDECLLEMLMAVTFVQFSENDNLPFQICLNCEKEVIRSYKFAQKCLEVNDKLKKCLKDYEIHRKTTIIYSSRTLEVIPEQENESQFEKVDNQFNNCLKQEIFDIKHEVLFQNEDETITKDSLSLNESEIEDNNDIFNENSLQSTTSDNNNKMIDTEQEKMLKKPIKPNTKLLGPPFECKKCYKTFSSTKLLWVHYQQVKHPRKSRIDCRVCSKSIQCSKMSMHMRIHLSVQPFGCDICGKRFNIKANLTRHVMIHSGVKPHKCPDCDKAFIQSTSLKHHSLIHTGEKPYICDHCGKSFASKGSLGTHIKNLGNDVCLRKKPGRPPGGNKLNSSSATYECEICQRKYHTKSLLNQHKLIHGEKKFLCSYCGRGFYRQIGLDSHLNIHTGIKPYSCVTCGKTFSQIGSLNTHKLLHTGAKPFVCKICDRRFTQRHHVTYHMRTHSGEKPHVCTVCGKSFALNGNLKVHIRTHTGETPYLCPSCGKGFYDSSSMKKHKLGCDKLKYK